MGLFSHYVLYRIGKRRARKKFEEYLDDLDWEIRDAHPNISEDELENMLELLLENYDK